MNDDGIVDIGIYDPSDSTLHIYEQLGEYCTVPALHMLRAGALILLCVFSSIVLIVCVPECVLFSVLLHRLLHSSV